MKVGLLKTIHEVPQALHDLTEVLGALRIGEPGSSSNWPHVQARGEHVLVDMAAWQSPQGGDLADVIVQVHEIGGWRLRLDGLKLTLVADDQGENQHSGSLKVYPGHVKPWGDVSFDGVRLTPDAVFTVQVSVDEAAATDRGSAGPQTADEGTDATPPAGASATCGEGIIEPLAPLAAAAARRQGLEDHVPEEPEPAGQRIVSEDGRLEARVTRTADGRVELWFVADEELENACIEFSFLDANGNALPDAQGTVRLEGTWARCRCEVDFDDVARRKLSFKVVPDAEDTPGRA